MVVKLKTVAWAVVATAHFMFTWADEAVGGGQHRAEIA